jgi:ribosomal 50S subunit-recycling heat shock protein
MRLDKFLKVSRLIKRRTVANSIAEQGRIFVNDVLAKPAKQLKVGDIIKIEQFNKTVAVKVLVIPTGNVPVQLAETLYEEL